MMAFGRAQRLGCESGRGRVAAGAALLWAAIDATWPFCSCHAETTRSVAPKAAFNPADLGQH
jgi:hypothetical protein